jgi:hypothetical protein
MEKTYTTQDWIIAYEQKVREILHYQGFTIKPSSSKIFKKLCEMYPHVNPYTFMESVFSPLVWWGFPDKSGGWKKIKYPFPNMLVSKKSAEIYHKYVKDNKPQKLDKQGEILKSVKTSLDKIHKLGIKITNLHELWYLTVDGTISPYIFACIDGSYGWVVLQCNKGETELELLGELDKITKYLGNHVELNLGIAKLLEEYDRNH